MQPSQELLGHKQRRGTLLGFVSALRRMQPSVGHYPRASFVVLVIYLVDGLVDCQIVYLHSRLESALDGTPRFFLPDVRRIHTSQT